ncbi:unnamed protein product [Euphydryas editha]|uniref:Cysteine-rich transmembrane CYSTM domain-containing protein n=1 Tax=Euphydryas editha TaxID=104508 RepID=A0AAU9TEN1_EUPED|nr:unnamed protein product [Euphydryas editha]
MCLSLDCDDCCCLAALSCCLIPCCCANKPDPQPVHTVVIQQPPTVVEQAPPPNYPNYPPQGYPGYPPQGWGVIYQFVRVVAVVSLVVASTAVRDAHQLTWSTSSK